MSSIYNVPLTDARLVNGYGHPWDYCARNTQPAVIPLVDPVTGNLTGSYELVWDTGIIEPTMMDENAQGLGKPTQLTIVIAEGAGVLAVNFYQANLPTTDINTSGNITFSGAGTHNVTLSAGSNVNVLWTIKITPLTNTARIGVSSIKVTTT